MSILSQFSQILKKLFVQKYERFIEKNKLLSESQYGFRSHRSTALPLMEIVKEITNAIENNYMIGFLIGLQNAFVTIDNYILISKLQVYGIRGTPLKWISS